MALRSVTWRSPPGAAKMTVTLTTSLPSTRQPASVRMRNSRAPCPPARIQVGTTLTTASGLRRVRLGEDVVRRDHHHQNGERGDVMRELAVEVDAHRDRGAIVRIVPRTQAG